MMIRPGEISVPRDPKYKSLAPLTDAGEKRAFVAAESIHYYLQQWGLGARAVAGLPICSGESHGELDTAKKIAGHLGWNSQVIEESLLKQIDDVGAMRRNVGDWLGKVGGNGDTVAVMSETAIRSVLSFGRVDWYTLAVQRRSPIGPGSLTTVHMSERGLLPGGIGLYLRDLEAISGRN